MRFRFTAIGLALILLCPLRTPAAQPVRARHAMVVTREPHATAVGVQMLKNGGNAVDAAIAVGFALAVTNPVAGNIGGGGFLLVRMADGRTAFLDFREMAPAAAHRDMYLDATGAPTEDSLAGWRASGVPGTVAGFAEAHKQYGSRRWAELLAPAISLASKGFPVSYNLAGTLAAARDKLERVPESRRIFLHQGRLYEPGDTFRQPDLAATLQRIATRGPQDFYTGRTANLIAQAMSANGGTITLEDLTAYRVATREPLEGSYRGYQILTAPPPSSGGVGILQMLGILEPTRYYEPGHEAAATIHYVAETMRRFYADRFEHFGDPDFVHVPIPRLLDPTYLESRRSTIMPDRVTSSAELQPGQFAAESAQTTHYSIYDAQGNAVAVTYTLNGLYGSGVTIPGAGFLMNNEMDDFSVKPGTPNLFDLLQGEKNAIAPKKRPLSSMTPTIVLNQDRPWLIAGSPGGPTIITTVLHILLNTIDFGMNIQDAVTAPRYHHQWQPDTLYLEKGISPDTRALLEARGHRLEVRALGEVSAILIEDGWAQGAADPRYYGTAEGY